MRRFTRKSAIIQKAPHLFIALLFTIYVSLLVDTVRNISNEVENELVRLAYALRNQKLTAL